MTRDGELTYLYDKNSNRQEIGYPGNVDAVYTFDFADRHANFSVERPSQAPQAIVTSSSYYAAGPARTVTFGNGVTETRLHDTRYHPDRITATTGLSTLLDWDYTTDKVGNPISIANVLNPTAGRGYVYQDFQYFLCQGDGPWSGLTWTYDRIGNRLSEVRNGQPADVYQYVANSAGGRDPRLDRINLGAGGTRIFEYDAAGNEVEVASGANVIERTYDVAGRLAVMERAAGDVATDLLYDGRSFLRHAEERSLSHIFSDGFEAGNAACWSAAVGGAAGSGVCPGNASTEPVYSSEGMLHAQRKEAPDVERYVFYFAGRPIATLADAGTSATWLWLSTDHLGTPILATRSAGSLQWSGGFEPFGRDFSGAQAADVFLRFPGQWDDESWLESSSGERVNYNVHRWYQPSSGRYTRPDLEVALTKGVRSHSSLPRLMKWFSQRCDGEWEHGHGISIESCDNPGWWVKVDLEGTDLEDRPFEPVPRGDLSTQDPGRPWLHCYVEARQFNGAGDLSTLDEILQIFLNWAES